MRSTGLIGDPGVTPPDLTGPCWTAAGAGRVHRDPAAVDSRGRLGYQASA